MNKEKQQVVPELRFPEFDKQNEWTKRTIGDFIASHKGGASLTPKDFVSKSEFEVLPKKAIIDGGWLKLDFENPTYCTEHFFNDNSQSVVDNSYLITTLRDLVPSGPNIGYIVKYKENQKYILAQGVYGLKLKSTIYPDYLIHYSNTNKYRILVNSVMVGSTQVHIRNGEFYKLPIPIPSKKEQQKIANCLSSLDNLITAETEKLDQLKDHKKGLLQQLFPAKGETKPQFRFPEFVGDGDWEIPLFSKYIKLYRGSSPRPINQFLTNDEDGVNWIKIGDTKNAVNHRIYSVEQKITIKGSKKSRIVMKGELILANSMSYGATYELELEGCIYDGWFVLREYEKSFDKQYLLQLLNSDILQEQYKRLAAGGIVQNISSEIVYNTTLPKPSKGEQQKIANCLSSADDLIQSQTTKIKTLKKHKTGLMQQLFPQ